MFGQGCAGEVRMRARSEVDVGWVRGSMLNVLPILKAEASSCGYCKLFGFAAAFCCHLSLPAVPVGGWGGWGKCG